MSVAEIKSLNEFLKQASKWIGDHEDEIIKDASFQGIKDLSIGTTALVVTIECQLRRYTQNFRLNNGWLIIEQINQWRLLDEMISALDFLCSKSRIERVDFMIRENYGFANICFKTHVLRDSSAG